MNNIIEIEIHNEKDYKNLFNNNRISNELNNYIMNELRSISLKDNITFEIEDYINLTKEDKEKLIKMLKLSFNDDLKGLKIYEKKCLTKAIILLFIGIIILLAYYLSNNMFFISEFILIIGWLLIWESANILFFSRTENKIEQLRRKQLLHSKIIYR